MLTTLWLWQCVSTIEFSGMTETPISSIFRIFVFILRTSSLQCMNSSFLSLIISEDLDFFSFDRAESTQFRSAGSVGRAPLSFIACISSSSINSSLVLLLTRFPQALRSMTAAFAISLAPCIFRFFISLTTLMINT